MFHRILIDSNLGTPFRLFPYEQRKLWKGKSDLSVGQKYGQFRHCAASRGTSRPKHIQWTAHCSVSETHLQNPYSETSEVYHSSFRRESVHADLCIYLSCRDGTQKYHKSEKSQKVIPQALKSNRSRSYWHRPSEAKKFSKSFPFLCVNISMIPTVIYQEIQIAVWGFFIEQTLYQVFHV